MHNRPDIFDTSLQPCNLHKNCFNCLLGSFSDCYFCVISGYKCDACDFESPAKSKVKSHIEEVHLNYTRECEVCKEVFKNYVAYRYHTRFVHNSKIHSILVTEHTFSSPLFAVIWSTV